MGKNDIIVVTGLPRSGTSLMMQILQSIGIEPFTDNQRLPNGSNPKGYFEHELVKTIEHDSSWIEDVKGKAIKIVSPLLIYLPSNYKYKIFFMDRNYDEIIQSQERMIAESNISNSGIEPEILKQIFIKDLEHACNWIREQPNCESLEISHSKLLKNPKSEIDKICDFLELIVDLDNAIKVIDKKLYRAKLI
jgi:sulfotransferase family protein